jgi:hypothetical protein
MPVFPVRTATWIAGCAAHDLTFWSDSPIPRTVWATSDDQRFHLVRVNTTDRTAVHVCREARYVPGMMEVFCAGDPVARAFPDVRSVAEIEGGMLAAAASLLARD